MGLLQKHSGLEPQKPLPTTLPLLVNIIYLMFYKDIKVNCTVLHSYEYHK